MPIAIALVLVVFGSVLFHLLSPWWWTPIASNWGYIDNTITITFWITGSRLFSRHSVHGLLRLSDSATAMDAKRCTGRKTKLWSGGLRGNRGRRRRDAGAGTGCLAPIYHRSRQMPRLSKWWASNGNGVFVCLARTENSAPPTRAIVSPENPLGLNPHDPNGQDDVVVVGDDLHLPVGKPVKVLLRATDVVHDFYVPEFRAKMDMIPGAVTFYWFTPTKTGGFDVLCAELCGYGHPYMRGRVVVDDETQYQAWLLKQKTFAQLSTVAQQRASN